MADDAEDAHAGLDAVGDWSELAALTRFVMRSRDITGCLEQAVDAVVRRLGAPMVALLEELGPGRVAVVHGHGPAGLSLDVWRPDTVDIAPPGLSVPVNVGGQPWGRLIVADGAGRAFRPTDVAFVRGVADILMAVLEREQVQVGSAWVAELGRYALGSRDIELTTQRAVDVVARALESPVSALLRHAEGPTGGPSVRPPAMTMVQAWGPIDLERGEEFALAGPDADLAAACSGHEAALVEDRLPGGHFPGVACLTVPVQVAGRSWGRLVVADHRPRRFRREEVALAGVVADILGAALEREQLESRWRRTAEALQCQLRPAAVPAVPGLELAAATRPRVAGRGAEVGGAGARVGSDWYDVLPLPQGGIGLVVGDVAGDDAVAAAVMAQVRSVLRAFVTEGHTPAEVVARVDRFVARHADRPVSCCYAELQPEEGSLTWAAGGGPAPWALAPGRLDAAGRGTGRGAAPGGHLDRLAGATGPALGTGGGVRYTDATALLPPGATVLLPVRAGDPRRAGVHPGDLWPGDLWPGDVGSGDLGPGDLGVDQLADVVARRLGGAVLVVRLGTRAADRAHRVFVARPESIPAARRFVRDVLTGWRLDRWRHTAALAVSELVTNTLVHTASPIDLTLRRTDVGGLWIGVSDDSDRVVSRRPVLTGEEASGRGLVVVATLADAWGVTPAPAGAGKTVWLELAPDALAAGGS